MNVPILFGFSEPPQNVSFETFHEMVGLSRTGSPCHGRSRRRVNELQRVDVRQFLVPIVRVLLQQPALADLVVLEDVGAGAGSDDLAEICLFSSISFLG